MDHSSAPRSSTAPSKYAHNKYKSPNPKEQKKQKKLDDEKVPSPKLVFVVYNSEVSDNCAHATQANNIQLDTGNALLLRVSDGSPSASYVQNFASRIIDLPDLDAMMQHLTVTCCIAVEHGQDNYTAMMSKNYVFQVGGDDTSSIRQLATIDDGAEEGAYVVTNLPVFDGLGDYRESLPYMRVIKFSMNTAPYHPVCIFARDDRIRFQNLVKNWMVLRLWVQTHEGATPEPHFASLHRRAE